jgi:hypothetical protein
MGKSLGRLGAFLAAAGLFSAAAQNICTLTLVDPRRPPANSQTWPST